MHRWYCSDEEKRNCRETCVACDEPKNDEAERRGLRGRVDSLISRNEANELINASRTERGRGFFD